LLARIPEQIPRILVANKADLPAGSFPQPVDVQLSALEGTGEADLVQALLERCGAAGTDGMLVALNQRQRDLAARAAEALDRVRRWRLSSCPGTSGPLTCARRSERWGRSPGRSSPKRCWIGCFRASVLVSSGLNNSGQYL